MKRPFERFPIVRFRGGPGYIQPLPPDQAWSTGARRGRVVVIGARPSFANFPRRFVLPQPPGGRRRFQVVSERTFSGFFAVKVLVYAPVR